MSNALIEEFNLEDQIDTFQMQPMVHENETHKIVTLPKWIGEEHVEKIIDSFTLIMKEGPRALIKDMQPREVMDDLRKYHCNALIALWNSQKEPDRISHATLGNTHLIAEQFINLTEDSIEIMKEEAPKEESVTILK